MRRRFVLTVGFLVICSSFALVQETAAPGSSSQQTTPPATSAQPTGAPAATNAQCIDCHSKNNPHVVSEWKQSKHSQVNVGCTDCHGADHGSASDVAKVKIARPEICAHCHQSQVDQYRRGKHSFALVVMKTMPNGHWRGMEATLGEQGCAGCHHVGAPHVTNEVTFERFGGIEGEALKWGAGACSSCHSRHTFSLEEARQPQTCQHCHSGLDSGQWEMYSDSRHGILSGLKQLRVLPADAAAPTCQTCHMPGGDHEVRTAWGYRGLKLPPPTDPQWAADQADILQALNVYDEKGKETLLLEGMKAYDVMRFEQADWQRERDKMVKICAQCHSETYSKQQLQLGDDMVRDSDHLLAQAIRIVAGLYKDGFVQSPPLRKFPWLTRFDTPPTVIEQKLETIYFDRMPAFHGVFHNSPKYAINQGVAKMERDLVQIKALEAELRRNPPVATTPPAKPATPQKAKPKAR
ncbi:MAG: multiheme c-type cytochrome [Terriglobales bacterium]